jgi:recombination protein RecT
MAEKRMANTEKKVTMAEYVDQLSNGIMKDLSQKQNKGLVLPPRYAASNALMQAMFQIKEATDKNGQPALSVCTPDSVKQSVMEMLTKGLDPAKKQCYFIIYGNKLTLFPSYFGIVHMAKEADPNIKDIYSEVVFEGDVFKYQLKHGAKIVTQHEQEIDNINLKKIKGAYATILYRDGSEKSEYMSMEQVRNSWSRGQTKGESSAHKLSPEEMAKRTVLKRLVKSTINTSNDEQLLDKVSDIDEEAEDNEALEAIDITAHDISERQDDEPEQREPEDAPDEEEPDAESDWGETEMPDIFKG